MQVRITKARSAPPRGYLVQWTVSDPPEGQITFDLERSGGPQGPWEPVATGLVNQYAYFDQLEQPTGTNPLEVARLNQLRFFQAVYYRVTAKAGSLTATSIFEFGPEAQGKIGGMRRKAARDLRIGLVKFSKMPCVLLKKRVWGQRCTACYDPRTKATTRGGCRTCYGTSFTGGFWNPVSLPARRQGPKATSVEGQPKSDTKKLRLVIPDFPEVNVGDIIVSLRSGERYRIDAETETDVQEEPMYQTATVTEIDRSDIVYQLRVDPTAIHPFF